MSPWYGIALFAFGFALGLWSGMHLDDRKWRRRR